MKPEIGQRVTIDIVPDTYTVYGIELHDKVLIRNNRTGDLSRLVVTNGKW